MSNYRAAFPSLAMLMAMVMTMAGCAPQTPAERRKADLDYWNTVGEKFNNVEADLASSADIYGQHEYDFLSGDIDTSLGEASTAHYVATQAPWSDVKQSLTAAADAMTSTLNDFKTGAQNNDASAMTRAYNDYVSYARNALAATKEARADYLHEGGKASDILDFYSRGNGGDSEAPALQYDVQELQRKPLTPGARSK